MVEIKNLVKNYGSKNAVDDISFTIKEGEIVGFLGPNGAGKSTTMNIITGYLSATGGSVTVGGKDIFKEPLAVKRQIGFLPEQPPLYIDMTVLEYLSFVFDLKCCDFNKKEHLNEVMEKVKILDVQNRLIKNLSKGYKQRVGIAQAIVGNPKFIIFDEPTVGLDPVQIIEIRNLIRSLGKKHTVILSTHILPEVQAICDRVIIINEGKIIANEKTADLNRVVGQSAKIKIKVAGPNREVLNMLKGLQGILSVTSDGIKEGDTYSYIIESNPAIDVRKIIFNALASRSWPMMGMENLEAELEDVFVKLIQGVQGKER
ncbi:MAG: ATP-binding cassette domain-containing protein [Ruminococcaceae bacterium]|nr:ATP-binding cassette domain-containing protein [Oscillospiraceae bacterium]